MTDTVHNPNPLNPPTENMRAYWEALGHFVHEFAHVEKMLFSILQRTAQVSMPVARAIFHGARSDGARQFINRMLEVTEPNPAIAEDFKFIFAQLAHITDARNSLLHYGTEFNEGTDFLSTNRFIALTKERVKNIPMSVEILNQMTADLDKISAHLLVHLVRGWADEVIVMVGDKLQASWRYTPPSQASRGGKTPNIPPAQ
jgi:hypothetical protein